MNTEPPFEGDVPDDGEDFPYEWLDEWLCEYVDGTMDPSLEAVFEQYVHANPELKAHVARLRETRKLLCNCGLPKDPSTDLDSEVCRDVVDDACPPPPPESDLRERSPVVTIGLVSSVTVALVIGFLVGATVVGPSSPLPTTLSASDPGPTVNETPASLSFDGTTVPLEEAIVRPHRMTNPFSAPDSVGRSSSVTTIGLP